MPVAARTNTSQQSLPRTRKFGTTANNSHTRPSRKFKPREKLSDEETKSLAAHMRTRFGWDDDPRPFQLAGVKAQLEGDDMIIQAPTGSGKTAVVAGPYVMSERTTGKCTIMVVPLLALQDEMVRGNSQ